MTRTLSTAVSLILKSNSMSQISRDSRSMVKHKIVGSPERLLLEHAGG